MICFYVLLAAQQTDGHPPPPPPLAQPLLSNTAIIIVCNVLSGIFSTCVQFFTIDNREDICSRSVRQGALINVIASFIFFANLRTIEQANFYLQIALALSGTIVGWLGFSRIAQKKNTFRTRKQMIGLTFALLNVGIVELQKRLELGNA